MSSQPTWYQNNNKQKYLLLIKNKVKYNTQVCVNLFFLKYF